MPPPETTAPATTDYEDDAPAPPRVSPSMSDDAIRDALRGAYYRIGDLAASEFLLDPSIQPKDLPAFKELLLDAWDTGDDQFKSRFDRLEREVVDEVAPRLLPNPDGSPNFSLSRTATPAPTTKNVAQGADPVDLFDGNLAYSVVDVQLNGAGMDFVFARTYSQLAMYSGPMGQSWDHGYDLWVRVDDDGLGLHRSTGRLTGETFRKHEQFDYWIPPDGVTGIIVENRGSFIYRSADGVQFIYQPHPSLQPRIHVIARIEDRFGNGLDFAYADGLLSRVLVNHPNRVVDFVHDTEGRLVSIRDFTGRVWRYDYDTTGDLLAVIRPATDRYKSGTAATYEYTGTFQGDPRLQHLLTAIYDADGRLYMENGYGMQPGLLNFRRVVRQRQGGGDVAFDYADVVEDFDIPYADHERPAHQTIVTERDGRQARHLFNRNGNMIFKEEYARLGGLPRLVASHYRYNRDGNLVGSISPLGVIGQSLYGRDIYERRFPRTEDYRPERDANLSPNARLQFDTLLAVVKRGRYHDVTSLNVAGGLWSGSIFPDVIDTAAIDVIQKFTYESEFAQLTTVSDPRFTQSADPAFVEDAEYERRLTRYVYAAGGGLQHLTLDEVELPRPTLPDGTMGDPIRTRFPAYGARGRVARIVGPNGLVTENVYFGPADGTREGYLQRTTLDPGGLAISRGTDRDELGRVVTLRRAPSFDVADGRYLSSNEYDELSQVVRSTGTAPFSVETRYAYTRAGLVESSEVDLRDASNNLVGVFATGNRYDEEGNLVSQVIGDGATSIKQTKVVFDRAARPFLTIEPSGRKRKTSFNERSLISTVIQDYGGIHATSRATYDADGRLARVANPRGSVTRFTYDSLGRVIDIEDARGDRTIRHFDKLGNLLVECLFERQGANAFVLMHRREFSYDELGRRVVAAANLFTAAAPTTAAQLRTAFQAAGPGNLLAIRSFYDSVGNLVKEVDQDDRVFISEFDVLGRVTSKVDPAGNEARLTYDKEGNVTRVDHREVIRDGGSTVIETRHFAEEYAYDELNRLVSRRSPAGVLRYAYDSRGNGVRIEDPLGHVIESRWDIFGRQVENRQTFHRHEPGDVPVPVVERFTYNLDDLKATQTDPLDRIVQFTYDGLGRMTSTVLPDGKADTFAYDRLGNLLEYRDRNGLVRRFGWDELDRNVSIAVDPTGLPDPTTFAGATSYASEYDALGRFTRVEDDFVVTRFDYNSLNHLLAESTRFTAATGLDPTKEYVLRRAFANTGAVTRITYPSGRELRYSRDILDRVVAIEQVRKGDNYPGDPVGPDGVSIATVEYAGRQPARVSRAGGLSTVYEYDFNGRTVGISHRRGAQDLLTLQFLFDRLGNMTERLELSSDHQGIDLYRYDSLSRLFHVERSPVASPIDLSTIAPATDPVPTPIPDRQSEIDALLGSGGAGTTGGYEYDLVGNRTQSSLDGVAESYTTNSLDQYTAITGGPRVYDASGNLVDDSTFTYRYDHRNQVSSATRKADGQGSTYFLDYFGRRMVARIGPSTTIDVFDGQDLIEQYEGSTLVRSVVSQGQRKGLLTVSTAGSEQDVLGDLVGSTRLILEGQTKRAYYLYDEFGNLRMPSVPGDNNPFRFAGKRILAETGLYDFSYRTYDPRAGRFAQRDPMGYVDGSNLYSFVRNNPLVLTDPLGLESRSEHVPIVGRLGAELAYRHPSGFTLRVPDNFDNDKVRAYKERINNPTDRGVGIRSRQPGTRSATDDLRRANKGLRNAYEASLPGGRRRVGTDIDHSVELQHIIRGNAAPGADTVRPQDHREQASSLNRSQGSQAKNVKQRQIQEGAPLDMSAGGVAREGDANKVWNREGYRTAMRYFGYYNMVGGTASSLSAVGDDIREGEFGSAALNTSGYLGGAFEIGGLAARSTALLKAGRWLGAPAAVISSGVIGVQIGTNLYENYVDHEMVLDVGSWVEEHTGSRVLGAGVAAGAAVVDAAVHAPEAAYDYVVENVTLDPDEIDWGRTVRPWRWF